MPDGRVGAVVGGAGNSAFAVFVPSDEGWLIDEVVLLALEPVDEATPAPSPAVASSVLVRPRPRRLAGGAGLRVGGR